ncbi:phosphoglycerate dehydrogenase [Glycomyces buryatensis]|uniref:D-3-phosphoglycerate dehydrogenase n=1 Tax=Glycomyces buryatensis TaxID=2570927 RepID=A0A4S8Q5P6_9ACTN|nr:phosphoglycerate dehydrogenase [Glycomyces buryatensis]THV38561.1 phosphoglycerate dehydrogenase [Glycomyces buryatensis]
MTEPKPVVVIADPLAPAAIEVLSGDFDVREIDGTNVESLHAALVEADAVIVRSATTINAAALEFAPKLKVIARAGVGLDNVDLPAATERGVMVVNAPTSNIVSAAEQAIVLLLASARHTARADASLREGRWDRKKFTGVEIQGKTLGVIGFGKIGQLVTTRMQAFDMNVVAYDPYAQPALAAKLGVKLVSLDEVLAAADFITIHLPKTPETVGLIGEENLKKVKPNVRIINAARGGLIDEAALAKAIKEGRVAGAGVDVFDSEPCTDSPLFELDQVVATPHLGASTREAQDNAGLAVAKSVKLALSGEFVPDAANVQAGGVVNEEVRPLLALSERLGKTFTALANSAVQSVTVEVRGEVVNHDVSVLQLAASKGLFADVADSVTYVNAPLVAEQRGVEVGLYTSAESPEFQTLVTLRGALVNGKSLTVSGTISPTPHHELRLTEIDGFELDIELDGSLLFLRYTDRPGVVGLIGGTLGDLNINIAAMQVARKAAGGEAVMAMALDAPVPSEVLGRIKDSVGATGAKAVTLED